MASALNFFLQKKFLIFFLKKPAMKNILIFFQKKGFSNFQETEFSYIFLKKFFLHLRKDIFRKAYLKLEVCSEAFFIFQQMELSCISVKGTSLYFKKWKI